MILTKITILQILQGICKLITTTVNGFISPVCSLEASMVQHYGLSCSKLQKFFNIINIMKYF